MICFFFPLFGVLQPEAASDFSVQEKGCRKSHSRCFFLPITLSRKGRICRKSTSKRREQARQPIFAPDKTCGGDSVGAATWDAQTDIKGKRLEKQGL